MTDEEVQALIDNEGNQFTTDDKEFLGTVPEGFLARAVPVVVEEVADEEPLEDEDKVDADLPADFSIPKGFTLLPEDKLPGVLASAKAYDEQQVKTRAACTKTLLEADACHLNDKDMEDMKVETLERVVMSLSNQEIDRSGQAITLPPSGKPMIAQPAPRNACFDPPKEVH